LQTNEEEVVDISNIIVTPKYVTARRDEMWFLNEKLANGGGQSLVVRGTLLACGIDLWPVIGHPIGGWAIDLRHAI
jgi:hypothetical protein